MLIEMIPLIALYELSILVAAAFPGRAVAGGNQPGRHAAS
jgi:Sec-independent protein secretion pathway component TatC